MRRSCYPSTAGNGDDEEWVVAVFPGRDEGALDLIVLEGEDRRDLFPNTA
jgi:hypothetical protein